MASILDRYGIKEVADVTFYKIDKTTGKASTPVLYLDTLKVSTIEQTAETTDARGGKGNPKLVTWDYGKDITVTLEDALFSAKSLAIMFGDGSVNLKTGAKVKRTVMVKLVSGSNGAELPAYFTTDVLRKGTSVRTKVYVADTLPTGADGVLASAAGIAVKTITSENGTQYSSGTWTLTVPTGGEPLEVGDKVFVTYEINANSKEIIVSGDTFPGTYYVTGDTYARSDVDGSDQFFQFIIPKAKVTSENTITLEAEGDPSVFNMNLTVLRPEDGEMMKLVQYDLATDADVTTASN